MAMDFFGHQEQARKASRRLVWLFVAAVLCIILLIYGAALGLLVGTADSESDLAWTGLPLLGVVSLAVVALVGGAMLFKTAQLQSGGAAVAEMMGGRPVDPHTSDPQERVLMNVVEEMAIASGVPVPDVFVLDAEEGVNAFAAGWSAKDAAVAVTRGSLEAFTRDELQGVIAHEFSHVFHGDMRLNIRLMGTLFGIICIAVIGRGLMYSGRRSRREGAQVALFGPLWFWSGEGLEHKNYVFKTIARGMAQRGRVHNGGRRKEDGSQTRKEPGRLGQSLQGLVESEIHGGIARAHGQHKPRHARPMALL